MKELALSLGQAQRLLRYEPHTGLFFWRISSNSRATEGNKAGTNRYGYIVITINGFKHRAHRLAWLFSHGRWPQGVIDHINGNRSDNRIANLRDVTVAVNTQNQKRANRDSKTGVLGATKHQLCNKYCAQITIDNKRIYLGLFATPELAHQAYLDAKRKYHQGCTL